MRSGGILLLYVLAVFTLLCGCRSSRNVEAQVQHDYSGNWLRLSRQMDSIQAGFQMSQRQVTDKLSNLKVEHVTTYYTLPDSAGKQYPVYVSTTKADKDEQTSEKVQTDMMATIRRMELRLDSLSSVIEAALREEQKVAEVSWWDRHKWRVLVPVVVVIIAVSFAFAFKKRKE